MKTKQLVMFDERSIFPSLEKIKELSDIEQNGSKQYINEGHSLDLFIYTPVTHITSSLQKLSIFMMNKKSQGLTHYYTVINKQGTYETNNYNVETLNYILWT